MTDELLALGPDRRGRTVVFGPERITAAGRIDEAPEGARGARALACPEAEIASAFVNAHTHLYSGLVPLGLPAPEPPPASFPEILERVWWRLDRALDHELLRAAARYYVAHALVAGTSALVDHHESPGCIERSLDVLADACQELGLRAVLCYGATERNGGVAEARRGLDECARFVRANRRPLVRGVVGLHASFTVSDETLRAAGDLARELGTVVHVHVAEDRADVEDARRRGYPGPLERLLALDALPAGSILAHGVHLTAEQVRAAERAGAWLVQNPRSNRQNRVGYPRALGSSARVALGTDGFPSVGADEIAALHAEAAGAGEAPADVEPRAGRGGALVAARFGRAEHGIEPGALPDGVARGADGAVQALVVGGRPVVSAGRLVAAELDEIDAEARRAAARLWRRMGAL